MRYSYFALVLFTTFLFILSDSLAANWGKNHSFTSLAFLFITAPIGYIFFGLINKQKTLAVSSGIVNVGLILGTILVSFSYFQESLSLKQIVGLTCAILAVYFLA